LKIHEYQAQELMRRFEVPVLDFEVVDSVRAGLQSAEKLFSSGKKQLVVKAQLHAGGRGKAGGIAVVKNMTETEEALNRILWMRLINRQTGPEGKIVRKVMIVDGDSQIERELYAGIVLDRDRECPVILASAEGGVDIEETAAKNPDAIVTVPIDPFLGLLTFQARNLAEKLGLKNVAAKSALKVFKGLYDMFVTLDCSQAEINPLVLTSSGNLVALDAKVNLDESAFFRHPELEKLRDPNEESELEVWASQNSLNYVKLAGDIGCMVNGAGLAMATMDTISLHGGMPANFLDVGGGANTETVTEAFKILLADTAVKAVLVNIFGGIVRCDRVAEGILQAVKEVHMDRPLVVRLAGTNASEGMTLLKKSDLPLDTADSLDEAAKLAVMLSLGG
jgi:succinyl-CoA synthetase beta subunit